MRPPRFPRRQPLRSPWDGPSIHVELNRQHSPCTPNIDGYKSTIQPARCAQPQGLPVRRGIPT